MVIIGIAAFLMSSGARAQDEDWFDKGHKLLGQQRYDDAIKAFSAAIEIIPRDYQSYNYRGVTWALKENFDRAIADYSKAIEIRPRYAEAYNNRGFAYTQAGNLKAAINDYTRALEINPFFVDAYNNKAWVLATCSDQRIRDGGQAVRLAQKAVELKPDISSMDTLAAAYAAVGNFDSAIDVQKKAIQKLMLADKNAAVHKYLAHLKSFRSRQALLIDYTAGPKTAEPQEAKASLKERTKKMPTPTVNPRKTATAVMTPKPPAAPAATKPPTKQIKPAPPAKSQKAPATTKPLKPAAVSSAMKTLTAQTKPAPPAKPQKAAATIKPPKPAAAPSVKKTLAAPIKPLPYTIQISAFRDPQRSNQVARKLNTNGVPAFTSPVDIAGKGKWYRVYIGNYKTLADARIAANDLKRRKFRYVSIAKKPYTVQVGAAIPKMAAQKLESRLQAKGYFSYNLPAKNDPNRIRILIGAFENKKAAASLGMQLKKDGFSPKIVPR